MACGCVYSTTTRLPLFVSMDTTKQVAVQYAMHSVITSSKLSHNMAVFKLANHNLLWQGSLTVTFLPLLATLFEVGILVKVYRYVLTLCWLRIC